MQIAFLLYDRFTCLDAIGPLDVLSNLPGAEPVFVAEKRGTVRNDSGAAGLVADRSFEEVTAPDILVVPGGLGTQMFLDHQPTLAWIRKVHESTKWTTSVCSGSLLLAAAGLLNGAPATTHWIARDLLAALGARPVPERVVVHGKIITAAGVSSGIDMALGLVQRLHGDDMAKAVQLAIEYDPQPPFDCGALEKADERIVEMARAALMAGLEQR